MCLVPVNLVVIDTGTGKEPGQGIQSSTALLKGFDYLQLRIQWIRISACAIQSQQTTRHRLCSDHRCNQGIPMSAGSESTRRAFVGR